jgi:presequence protease
MPDLMGEADLQTKLGISYLANQISEDPYESFCLQILSSLMMDGPNSPFYKRIIEAGVAPNFCPGAGYDCTTKEATFTMGVQGIKLEDVRACEKALYETLQEVAEKGIEERFFETILHQVEFNGKRTKDHFGLACISHMVPYALHGGDPLSIFHINEYSQRIRDDFKCGGFFEGLVRKHFLDNPHKLTLLAIPDPEVGPKEEQAEKSRLEQLKKALSEDEKQTIV